MVNRTNPKPTSYAMNRLFQRGIAVHEAVAAVRDGIEVFQQRLASPRPSVVFLGWVERPSATGTLELKPVHVVAADDPDGTTAIITAYWPSQAQWDATFTRRIK